MKGLALAVRYLTIVPWGVRRRAGSRTAASHPVEALGRAAVWFPVVGLAIGLALVLVEGAAARIFPPLLAALLTVVAWKLLTGGLHLDGLADCLDGLGGRDPGARLAIMRDSRIGTFGALGLILVLLLDVGALAEVAAGQRWRVLLAAPVIGRAVPVALARLFPPARPDGQGTHFRAGLRAADAPITLGTAALVAVAVLGVAGLVALGMALLLALAFARALARRLDGITGDVLGATVELAELAVLLTGTTWTSLRP